MLWDTNGETPQNGDAAIPSRKTTRKTPTEKKLMNRGAKDGWRYGCHGSLFMAVGGKKPEETRKIWNISTTKSYLLVFPKHQKSKTTRSTTKQNE